MKAARRSYSRFIPRGLAAGSLAMGFPKGRGAAPPFGRPTGFIPRGGEIKLIRPHLGFSEVRREKFRNTAIQPIVMTAWEGAGDESVMPPARRELQACAR